MADAYCGIKKVPKGRKRGSMQECAEAGKIAYYGLKKIDTRMLEYAKARGSRKMTRDKLLIKMASLKGKVKKYTTDINHTKNKTAKTDMEKELKKIKAELSIVLQELNKKKVSRTRSLNRSRRQSRSSRSRKGSKSSRKRSMSKSKSKSRSRSRSRKGSRK